MTNIIIQAGGSGTRMNNLTSIKPKCLIPIDGKPILFHLFDSNPDANFILVVDYCSEVIKKYIKKFRPNIKVKFIDTTIKSTSAGLIQAIQYLNDESFYVVWSDLLIKDKLNYTINGNIGIGITNNFCNFPCRWCYENNKIFKKSTTVNGVSGIFWFKHKNLLNNIDETKSLTSFLENQNFSVFDIKNIEDIGTEDRFYKNHKNNRFFNKLTFENDTVKKEAVIDNYKQLISDEINWYNHVTKLNYNKIPKIFSETPFIMERLHGGNPFDGLPNKKFLLNCIKNIQKLHSLETVKSNTDELNIIYQNKTLERIKDVSDIIPFFEDEFIIINDIKCINPFHTNHILKFKEKISTLNNIKCFNLIHGDCTFSNIINVNGECFLIDPRGYFGKQKLYGDPRYDWAKLYYSFYGNYDNVNSKKYSIKINSNSVEYKINSNGWEKYENIFFKNIPYSKEEIKLIHTLIWFSLCGYVIEDYSSILLSFYNGIFLWNQLNNLI